MPLQALLGTASVRAYGRFQDRPDPYIVNVSLLMHCDGVPGTTAFVDSSPVANALTANGNMALASNAPFAPRFGTANLRRVLAAGDNVSMANAAFNFGVGDFTVELWYFYSSAFTPDSNSPLFVNSPAKTFMAGFGTVAANTNLTFYGAGGPVDNVGWAAPLFPNNTWYHLAWVRNGAKRQIFVNGQSIGSANDVGGINFTPPAGLAYVGAPAGNTLCYGGMDDIRITKGVARYTANFSPPGKPFPNV